LTPAEIREKVQPGIVEDDSVRAISGAFISKLASPWGFDWARRIELFGALIVGIILDTFVLGLCISGVVMAFLARSI
jgi:hypothetical protein